MRRIGVIVMVLVASTSCDRGEEPRSRTVNEIKPKPATSRAAAGPSPGPKAGAEKPPTKPSCVVPTPDEPPPEAAPATRCPPDPLKSPPELPKARIVFSEAPGQPSIEVELATSQEVRSRGLMYRRSMANDAGMLFVWNDDRPRSFWMHNTCIPLDMLFIDREGYIVGILEQVPTMNDQSRRNPCPARQVLEVNAGYCRRHGIRAGQRLDISEE
jgi:uncharacterized membrane protein (UPF0127 family)